MFETGDFQTPAPPESGVAGNAVASTPQDHWLYNELVDGFHIDRVVRDYNYSMDIRHIHEEYEIYYLLEGERYYFINQQTYLVTPGTLVFIDKEQIPFLPFWHLSEDCSYRVFSRSRAVF